MSDIFEEIKLQISRLKYPDVEGSYSIYLNEQGFTQLKYGNKEGFIEEVYSNDSFSLFGIECFVVENENHPLVRVVVKEF